MADRRVMDAVYLDQFDSALSQGDETSALSLLESGRVTIHSRIPSEIDGNDVSTPLIFFAVQYVREQVARALARLGADLEALCPSDRDGGTVTPAGDTIFTGNVDGLALCHRLGASMSCVFRSHLPLVGQVSAVDAAIQSVESDSLAYFLDSVRLARPIELDMSSMTRLSCLAHTGGRARPIFRVLETRGFNFKLLELAVLPGGRDGMTIAELLLTNAQKSGDAGFLRYIVKDLSVVSTAGRLDVSHDFVTLSGLMTNLQPEPEVALVKYVCAACQAVRPTIQCTGCRVTRYCSKECSRRHWKTGGHKTECKELKRARAAALTTPAGDNQL